MPYKIIVTMAFFHQEGSLEIMRNCWIMAIQKTNKTGQKSGYDPYDL